MNGLFRRHAVAWPKRHRALFPAFVGACVLFSPALAGCGSASAGYTGYDWQVIAIRYDGMETSIPARLQVTLQFGPYGQFGASDSVNSTSGEYRATSDGFTTSDLSSTAVGYAGHDPAVVLATWAIASFDSGVQATAKLTADRLVVGIGLYTLTCLRRGAAAPRPTPLPVGAPEIALQLKVGGVR
jgi:hypothetical protein